jgi:hypothetical protein
MTRLSWLAFASCALLPTGVLAEDEAPPLSIYGAARLDILADDSRMSDIHEPRFVMHEPSNGQLDGELTMTPRLSQLGLGIDEWEINSRGDLTGEGLLEIDFGGGTGTNAIRLRHAYAQVDFRSKLEVLAGQTWDLISPLVPSAQNDTQLLSAGNTGDRRPQLRIALTPARHVQVAVAAAATGALDPRDMDADGQLDGMASATPMLQGIVELRPRTWRGEHLRIGMWAHVARAELANGTRQPSRSIGGHLYVPFANLVWSTEIYGGTNLADIGGGIGQGVNPVTGRGIRAYGGWTELAVVPSSRHVVAIGTSGDFARASDLEVGDRRANTTSYGVIRYKPKPALQLGLEYLYWKTLYHRMSGGVANRFNVHLSVLF